MNQNLTSISVRNCIHSIFILTLGLLLGGCSSIKIKNPENGKLLNKEVNWKGASPSVYVDVWGEPGIIELVLVKNSHPERIVNRVGVYSKGGFVAYDGSSMVATHLLNAYKNNYDVFFLNHVSDEYLIFVDYIDSEDTIATPLDAPALSMLKDTPKNRRIFSSMQASSFKYSILKRNFPERLSATLNRSGLKVISNETEHPRNLFNDLVTCQKAFEDTLEKRESRAKDNNTDYYVTGQYYQLGLGKYWDVWLLWDVVMAVPSAILPVPIGVNYNSSIEVTLYDSGKNIINSRNLSHVEVSAIYYSCWSAVNYMKPINTASIDAATSLVIEMIQESESKKTTNIRNADWDRTPHR